MKTQAREGGWLILLTFVVAMILTIAPLPELLRHFRPEWSALVFIYWCMALPHRIGIGIGWMIGLLLDVLTGTLLGQHALGMTVIAFITINLHQRLRLFPLWQQAIFVWMVLNLYQLLLLWFYGITGQASRGPGFWISPIVGMILWPGVFLILRSLRRRFKVS